MKKSRLLIILLFALGILFLGNPTERQYLQQVAHDFGKIHHGMSLNINDLTQMGDSSYQSYLFVSTYAYAFGNIQVTYLGIAFMKFYLGSSKKETTDPNIHKTLQRHVTT